MGVVNGADLLKNLMKVQSDCPNCGTTLTFEDSARLGRANGVTENAVMCHNCYKVFNVNIMPDKMEILDELTKYAFSSETVKEVVKEDVVKEDIVEEDTVQEDMVEESAEEVVEEPVEEEEVVNADAVQEDMVEESAEEVVEEPVEEEVVEEDIVEKDVVKADVDKEEVVKDEVKPQITSQNIQQNTNQITTPKINQVQNNQQQISSNSKSIKDRIMDLKNDDIFQFLFYKTDAEYGLLRPSKTKILSALWFILLFVIIAIAYYAGNYGYIGIGDIISSIILALVFTLPVFVVGWVIAHYIDKNAKRDAQLTEIYQQINNQQNMNQNDSFSGNVKEDVSDAVAVGQSVPEEEISQDDVRGAVEVNQSVPQEEISQDDVSESVESGQAQYFEKDNLGSRHDSVDKANAYWLGERFLSKEKYPFSLYVFKSAKDAEDALLELPYIHKASDTGNLICDDVFIFGYYKVSEGNYEAIVCGKDLTYDEFEQAEDSFKKHGGTLKNNLEPDKSAKKVESNKSSSSSVKFRDKFSRNQYTYECYDADSKSDAMEFLKGKDVTERCYYVCVYTPEGDYGRDIDGIYQM